VSAAWGTFGCWNARTTPSARVAKIEGDGNAAWITGENKPSVALLATSSLSLYSTGVECARRNGEYLPAARFGDSELNLSQVERVSTCVASANRSFATLPISPAGSASRAAAVIEINQKPQIFSGNLHLGQCLSARGAHHGPAM
jgi:hypothetical protein